MQYVQWEVSRLSTSSSIYSRNDDKTDIQPPGSGTQVLRSHSGWATCRHWIHLAAIAVTAGLATLNLRNVYLMDFDYTNSSTILNVFQFAAKLHEVTIVGSLMLILMDMVRHRLLTPTGVPLGFLLSPTLFNDLDWLLSSHFWAAMKPNRSSLQLVCLVLVAIPFANIAGPLSAIVVVPRVGWSGNRAAAIYPSFFNASAAILWPESFSASSLDEKCFTGAGQAKICPGNAIAFVNAKFSPRVSGPPLCTTAGSAVSCNASAGDTSLRDLSVEYDRSLLTAYSSTPPPLIYEVLASRVQSGFAIPLNISHTEIIDTKKTQLVEAHLVGGPDMLKPITKTVCQDLTYSQIYQTFQNFSVVTDWSTPFVHWLADIDGSEGPKFLFTYLRNDSSLDASIRCDGEDCYGATSCGITTFWAPVHLWHNSADPASLYHSDPQPSKIFNSKAKMSLARPVQLKRDWLETLAVPDTFFNISRSIPNFLNEIQTPMAGEPRSAIDQTGTVAAFNPTNYSQAIAVVVSSLLTEAVGGSSFRFGDSLYSGNCSDVKPGFSFSPGICAQTPSHWIHADGLEGQEANYIMTQFTVRRNGYGWFIENITVKIALGILALHALSTLAYLVIALVFTRTITTCWSSAPEMVMLAITSLRAPILMGSSAKARNKTLWREPVSVMEVDNGERVSLIVGDPYSYPERLGGPPVLGKKYQ